MGRERRPHHSRGKDASGKEEGVHELHVVAWEEDFGELGDFVMKVCGIYLIFSFPSPFLTTRGFQTRWADVSN
jgi:hypothetical protein